MIQTMKLHLHPQWEGTIDTFVNSYNEFADAYTTNFPRYRNDELMTPNVAYIHHEMKRWIKKFNTSLLCITEQAFEAVHYDFLSVETQYKITRTGKELIAGQRRFTSDPSFGKKKQGSKAPQASKKRNTNSRQRKQIGKRGNTLIHRKQAPEVSISRGSFYSKPLQRITQRTCYVVRMDDASGCKKCKSIFKPAKT